MPARRSTPRAPLSACQPCSTYRAGCRPSDDPPRRLSRRSTESSELALAQSVRPPPRQAAHADGSLPAMRLRPPRGARRQAPSASARAVFWCCCDDQRSPNVATLSEVTLDSRTAPQMEASAKAMRPPLRCPVNQCRSTRLPLGRAGLASGMYVAWTWVGLCTFRCAAGARSSCRGGGLLGVRASTHARTHAHTHTSARTHV